MSVIAFTESLKVSQSSWSQIRRDVSFDSVFGAQSVEVSTPLWQVSISSPDLLERDSGEWQALMLKLRGQTNQLSLWNHGRPSPRGTMRGTMTLNAAIVQGDVVISIIAASEISKTLLVGDLIGVGTGTTQQVVMVVADATSNGSGVISITVEPPVRNAHSSAAAVTHDKPKVLFRRQQSEATWEYSNILASGFSLNLIEDIRA